MKPVKVLVFVLGLFLINYVGGMPNDARNLFISHCLFFVPFLIDFYPLMKVENVLRYLIIPIFWIGIFALGLNILGILGIINVGDGIIVGFSDEYFSPIPLKLHLEKYLLFCGIVYTIVFMGTLTLSNNEIQHQNIPTKMKNNGKELVENVPN